MSEQAMHIVEHSFMRAGAPGAEHLLTHLSQAAQQGVDYCDFFFQSSVNESWMLEQGAVKDAAYRTQLGVGARGIVGDSVALAYTEDLSSERIQDCLTEVSGLRALSAQQQPKEARIWLPPKPVQIPTLYVPDTQRAALEDGKKIAFLKQADLYARSQDQRVTQVMISVNIHDESVWILNSAGLNVVDQRPLVRFNAQVVLEDGAQREQGYAGYGGRYTLDQLFDEAAMQACVDEAIHVASVAMRAVSAPAGVMPVVLGNAWPGVLLHEAIGHGLEADFHRRKSSAFTGMLGEQIASSLCTIVDDGTIQDARGSVNVDDEGTPGQYTTLVKDGVLESLMTDRLNAELLGMAATGNGRRESYDALPMPRMTNTYMLPGESSPEEIIQSVDDGIYAVNFGGGEVDITSGKFVFAASEAYRIRGGKIEEPIKGVMLVGDGSDVLKKISMVGDDFAMDPGIGTCGKDGQGVVVGVGQSTLLVDELTIGGTNG